MPRSADDHAAEQGTLEWSGPELLLLGEQQELKLTLRAPDAKRLVLLTNVGQLASPEPAENGSWTVTYTAPSERFPQIALIAAYDPATHRVTQHRVALVGQAKVVVDSEPNVSVDVFVADQRFGPVSTDYRGIGEIVVHVPPGESVARTVATDAYGNVTHGEIPLNAPNFVRHLLICPAKQRTAYVIAVDSHAKPLLDSDFSLEGSAAQFEETQRDANGLFHAVYHFDDSVGDGTPAELRLIPVGTLGVIARCRVEVSHPSPPPPSPPPPPPPPPPPLPEPTLKVVPVTPAASSVWTRITPGIRFGYVTNLSRVGAALGAARVEFALGPGQQGIRVGPEVGFYAGSDRQNTLDGEPVDLVLRALPVLAGMRYQLPWGPLIGSAGLALGAVWVSMDASSRRAKEVVSRWEFMLAESVIVGVPLEFGTPQLELGYWWTPVDAAGISGNAGGVNVTAGIAF